MPPGDRSVVVRLRAEIADYKAKMTEASRATDQLGQSSTKTSQQTTGMLAAVGQSVRSNTDSWNKLSNTAGAAAVGLGAGVGLVVKSYATFDKSMSQVAATGDDARQNMEGLREAAIKAGADTAFSAAEAANGMEELFKAGLDTTDVMSGGLTGALDLAAAGQLSVADAAETTAVTLQQFGLEGDKASHVADLLAAGAGKAVGEVSDMGQALNQAGLVSSQFGLSVEDTVGSLSAFASAGLIGSDAGTSFRSMLLHLANPAQETADLMSELGINAYDAQGQFVGIEALAGQLQTQLSGLTQAQRDAALAQIFGSDAIRAANVLYKEGSDGIAQWKKDVDDSGYAAEVAATKTDNLAGDIERLGGSLDSVFLQSGSGANDALRGLIQGLEGLVDKVGEVPTPALEAGLGIAAVGAAGLGAVAGVSKIAVTAVELKDAFSQLAPAGGRARGALVSVGRAAGVAAAGFIALQAIGAALEYFQDPKTVTNIENVEAALTSLADGTSTARGALNDLFTRVDDSGGTTALAGSVNDLTSAFEVLNAVDQGGITKVLFDMDALGSKLVGTESDLEQIRGQFALLDESLTGMEFEEAAAGFAEISAQAQAQGTSVAQLVSLFPEYKAQLEAQATQLGINNLTNSEYVAWMEGSIPPAVLAAGEAAVSTGESTEGLGAAMDSSSMSAEQLEAEMQSVIDALTILNEGALDAERANLALEAAFDDLTAAEGENRSEMDAGTEAGRRNRQSIIDAMDAVNQKIRADFDATAQTKGLSVATEQASEDLKENRKRLREAAEAAGYSEREVDKMIDTYMLTPEELKTQFSTIGLDEARDGVQGLDRDIRNVDNKTVKVSVKYDVNSDGSVSINGGPRMSPYATGGEIVSDGTRMVSGIGGGGIFGPGGPTDDVIPIWASAREYMIKADSADKIGKHDLDWMNRTGTLPPVRGYRAGGQITRDLDVLLRTSEAPTVDATIREFTGRVGRAVGDAVKKELPKNIGTSPLGSNDLVSLRGHRFTENFANRLRMVERALGVTLAITQGGWRPATSYSGTSHAGDAVDIARPFGFHTIDQMRKLGIAAWDRSGKGNWIDHIHGVPLPYAGRAGGSAKWQAQDYLAGGDGLAAGGLVYGYGGPRDDANLRRLSHGEHVTNADATSRSLRLLQDINQGRVSDRNYVPAARSAAATPQVHIDHRAIAAAVQAGMAGTSWSARINGRSVEMIVDERVDHIVELAGTRF